MNKDSISTVLRWVVPLCMVAVLIFTFVQTAKTTTIFITPDGFSPEELRVTPGTTVSFINKKEQAWPASDPHPTHELLTSFDSKHILPKGATWTYTFTKEGIWTFHDHLAPAYTGTVIVSKGTTQQKSTCITQSCFNQQLRKVTREKGIASAFRLLADAYDNKTLTAACHWSAHQIGDEAYKQTKNGKTLDISAQTYYCGYGFYHGYLEAMLRENPDPKTQKNQLATLCTLVDQELQGEAADNCYHGIGSGFTENPPNPAYYGNPDALVQPGLTACEKLFGSSREWEVCTTGVFAVPANFMSNNQYAFSFDENDPFVFCRKLDKRYHRACFGEFAGKLDVITQWNVEKIIPYTKTLDTELAALIVRVGTGVMMQRDAVSDAYLTYQSQCKSLPESLTRPCIEGVIWGLLYHGRIDQEQTKAFLFCDSFPSSEEKKTCYAYLADRAKNMFSPEKFARICAETTPLFKQPPCP